MTEQKKFWGIQAAFLGTALLVGGGLVFAMSPEAMPDKMRDQFGLAVPSRCQDITPYTLNRVLANAPLIKMTGVKVLEVTRHRALDPSGHILNCSLSAMLSTGADVTISASTDLVNQTIYMRAEIAF